MLRDLQSLLCTVYAIDQPLDIYDYLVTDARMLAEWETKGATRPTREKLLIQESEDELGMLLFLDEEMLERLLASDPRQWLGHGNLADFCTVLEGISHLIYLAWNAAADKSVTLMELEMQAEVDKYIGSRVLLENQTDSNLDEALFARLFDEPAFDENLSTGEFARYRDASNFAGRYCRSLERRFPAPGFGLDMIRDLRAFYRLPQPAKISHIQSAFFA
jgi:hypothetical protein